MGGSMEKFCNHAKLIVNLCRSLRFKVSRVQKSIIIIYLFKFLWSGCLCVIKVVRAFPQKPIRIPHRNFIFSIRLYIEIKNLNR